MALTQVQKLQLNKQVDKILNTPGNFQGGNLEMTMVFDYDIDETKLKEQAAQIISTLKSHSPVFRNVRFNGVKWESDTEITSQVVPMMFVQMGKFFEETKKVKKTENNIESNQKNLEVLLQKLKLFHARSKLIIILTNGQYQITDKEASKAALNPFLKGKLLLLEGDTMKTGMQLFMELIQ